MVYFELLQLKATEYKSLVGSASYARSRPPEVVAAAEVDDVGVAVTVIVRVRCSLLQGGGVDRSADG